MDMYKDDSSPYCYFHPKEEYVGVCPLCLNERLLVLASKQRSSRTKHSSSSPIISLPKIFALSSLLNRLDLRHRKFHPSDDLDVSTSQEDSFISIKFENDGNASWEKKTVSKVCVDNTTNSTCNKKQQSPIVTTTSIVEHNSAKSSLRWRKRIGQLFHVIKLRSGSSTSSCHVASSNVEGAKVRKQGWMVRTLTRRKSKKSRS
ncbi:hypothetical protein V5N11_035299 [Cardamine amara subsp. amara]|uniref:Uncharacterized protein n=1 Tax=Cardamine amara subsp. amara TaxID=228776 RepID=A0ABD1A4E0_CARAN